MHQTELARIEYNIRILSNQISELSTVKPKKVVARRIGNLFYPEPDISPIIASKQLAVEQLNKSKASLIEQMR
ncbi:hypothetical protein BLNAU_15508 [Blattamonas nauphoetae]|uniref:Valyl-tRNA synthetase tRNA-binding arm domain-containing protein n=1 Tax=Blattamonas nauphoetae TaxID=2049346 RepID=A0ABQ9XGV9_9EUKA|nr:hypothetical protein BLNAU_15508 [Blattamonas nauphoetae]